MLIGLSGTPGTGKTTISSILNKKYKMEIVNLHKFASEYELIDEYDSKRKSDIIDINILNKTISKIFNSSSIIIFDGHIAHLLPCLEKIIILRCHPNILEKRLNKRDWSNNKIKENVEAEILDVILSEAVTIHGLDNVIEIDSTNQSIEDLADLIYDIISNSFKNIKRYQPGCIDWSEELFNEKRSWGR